MSFSYNTIHFGDNKSIMSFNIIIYISTFKLFPFLMRSHIQAVAICHYSNRDSLQTSRRAEAPSE